MFYIVYKTTNQVNGKFYIGTHKTVDLNDDYLGSGKYLKHAIEKYGIENFNKEILFVFDNPEDMFAKEAEIVTEDFISENNTYNLKKGGFGGFDYINSLIDQSWKSENGKNSLHMQKLNTDPAYRKKLNESVSTRLKLWHKEGKISAPNCKGKKHTEESKRKISEKMAISAKGIKNSQYGKIWIHNKNLKNSIRINKNDPLPNGWELGRKIKWD